MTERFPRPRTVEEVRADLARRDRQRRRLWGAVTGLWCVAMAALVLTWLLP